MQNTEMVYVSNGQVLDSRSRSPLRLSFWTDLFWGAVEFIGLFFQTLFQPDLPKNGSSRSHSRYDDGRGPPKIPWATANGKDKPWGGPSAPPMGEEDEEGKCLHFMCRQWMQSATWVLVGGSVKGHSLVSGGAHASSSSSSFCRSADS